MRLKLKVIPRTNELYMATKCGQIYSVRSKRFLKVSLNNSSYQCVILYGCKKTRLVHRLVMQAFVGESKLTVNHINGIKTDNRIENLEYATHSQNEIHAYKIGLKKTKFDKNKAKFLYSAGLSFNQIAGQLKISRSSVSNAIHGSFDKEYIKLTSIRNISKFSKNRSLSIEDRIKKSKAKNGKAINVYNYETKQFVGRFETLGLASEELKVARSSIRCNLKKKYKQFNGYFAEYV